MQIETGLLCEIGCGGGARVICLFARVVQPLAFWTQRIQANVDYRYVWRREETRRVRFARPWTQASKPALTGSSLAAKRRAAALYVVFFQPSIRAQHDYLLLLLCVLVRYVATKDARRVRCSSWSQVRARVDRQLSVWAGSGEARRLRSRIVVVFQRIDRCSYFCVYLNCCCNRVCSVRYFLF